MRVAALALLLLSCGPAADQPLKKAAEIPLPDSATRFDYQSIDPTTGRLYLSHMGAGKLIVFDTKTNKIVANLDGYKTVTGVLAVPEEGKLYASAAGIHEVVIADLKTNQKLAGVSGANFPDGIAYAPKERRVFVSDESGGIDLVIDARTNRAIKAIELGGEAGNSHYDPVTHRIWVAVQTKNEMVEIDPVTLQIKGRHALKGSDHPHGFALLNGIAYISCEGNDKLLVSDLRTMNVSQSFDVTTGPDVLAIDEGLHRLYVACEGGAVDVFKIETSGSLRPIGKFTAPAAHTVSVDQKTHRVYLALKSVGGKPQLWILEPR
jgi:DNA-binding beta-propeller fold protein YncE